MIAMLLRPEPTIREPAVARRAYQLIAERQRPQRNAEKGETESCAAIHELHELTPILQEETEKTENEEI